MIFQTELSTLDTELSQLQALLDAKRQQRSLFEELDAETNATIETVARLKTRIEAVSSDAIASLKSAVLTLFDSGDDGSDGGNQPTDPTPEPDDSEPELLCFNGVTGECLTTADDEELPADNPVGDEWVLSSSAPLIGQTCAVNPELYWEITPPDGSSWEFASPLTCLLWEDTPMLEQYCTVTPTDNENKGTEEDEIIPQSSSIEMTEEDEIIPQSSSIEMTEEDEIIPQSSSIEMIHTSARTGYLKLRESGQILATYAWFPRKDLAESWFDWLDGMSLGSPELRLSQRNSSWKYEIKLTGLSMTQIERLSQEDLSRKPSKKKETPAQAAGLEPPNGWRQAQPTEAQVTAEAPKKARITLESSPYNGQVCDVVDANDNWWTLATPKGNLKYPADSVEPVDEGVQMAQNRQEAEAIAFEFGDIAQVVADLNDTHLVGSFGKVKFVKDGHVALEIDEQVVLFQSNELSLKAKAEVPQQQQQQSGQVLLGNRIVTNGNYVGAARRTAIANARRGTANKIAALELVKAGLSPELAMAAVTGTDDASDF